MLQSAVLFKALWARGQSASSRRRLSSAVPNGKPQATRELRKAFKDYFAKNQHLILPSSNLVPRNDPSLLFTTAGMVQFKDYFLGNRTPPAASVSTVQRCVRAGGKHNDLENVGYTARHQTFFEMLGNFSFGSYWKTEAIQLAWAFLTQELGLPADRLSVTVLEGDEDTAGIWRSVIGLPDSKIRRCGPEDNFWAMGDVGPCGPCTEIFWDQGKEIDGERYLEIWNLVFMQYQRAADGSLTELPVKCIDTGMGLERLASVVQGKPTNWETDGLAALCDAVEKIVEKRTGTPFVKSRDNEIATRVIVDHLRACSLLISEGLIPGFHSRQYVLRRLQRRAIRYGHKLGLKDPFLAELLPSVIESLGDTYPELIALQDHIKSILTNEETLFSATISRALDALEHEFKVSTNIDAKLIPGSAVWSLYSKYGFPVDLTDLVAKERGWTIDVAGFEVHLREAQELSRSRWKGSGDLAIPAEVMTWTFKPKFVGYEQTHVEEARICAITPQDHLAESWAVLDPCPFYAESGGQVGDQGYLTYQGATIQVIDTVSPYEGGIAIKIKYSDSLDSQLAEGAVVAASVRREHRLDTQRNHTATHLLHAALRQVLGSHVTQAGSLVEPDRLRFDFTHNFPLTAQQIEQVEDWVNSVIQTATPVHVTEMEYEVALEKKAMALFTEKYGGKELVRVVQVGDKSTELCGGTHASESSQLLCFKVVSQLAVGSGVRRIVAVTGPAAVNFLRKRSETVERLSSTMRTESEHLQTKIEGIIEHAKSKEREVVSLQSKLQEMAEKASGQTESNGFYVTYLGSFDQIPLKIHYYKIPQEIKLLRERSDRLRVDEPDTAHLILCGEKVLVSFAAGDSGQVLRSLIKRLPENICKGGGGKTVADARVFVPAEELLQALKKTTCIQ